MPMKIPYETPGVLPEGLLERLGRFSAAVDETEKRHETIDGSAEAFEREFCTHVNAPYAVATSSSTSALHLAMCTLDLKRGDKVACSVNAYVDVPEVVRHFDAEPLFVDCDPRSYNMDLDRLEETLERYNSKKLRAVIVNPVAGCPLDMERLWEIAERYDVHIVEDATDAWGTRYLGGAPGSFEKNILTVFSMGNKQSNRFDGGVLVSHREDCHQRAVLLRNHGMVVPKKSPGYLYDVTEIGCQYRMNDFDALYARYLLEGIEEENRRRREIAEECRKALQGLHHVTLPVEEPGHGYDQFIVEIDRNRDAFARALKERGIETRLHYIPLHTTQYYKEKYGIKLFDFPQAMHVYQRILSLPNRPDLSEEELSYITETVREIDAVHV